MCVNQCTTTMTCSGWYEETIHWCYILLENYLPYIKIQVPQLPFNIACNIIQSCRIVLYRQTKHTHTHIINSNCACMQFSLIFDTVQHVIRPQAVMSIVPSSHCKKTALYLRSKQDLSTKSLVRRAAECTLDKHAGHWTNR